MMESFKKRRKIEGTKHNMNNSVGLSHESEQVGILTVEAKDSMDSSLNINSLPTEVLHEIFKNLTHNELGRVSRVCKRWQECARIPVLWKNVYANFFWHRGSQSKVATIFAKNLPSSVICMKLEFKDCGWQSELNFERLCRRLKERCPHLHTLILYHAYFSVSLPSVVNFCSEFLQQLKKLVIYGSKFVEDRHEGEYGGFTEIEVLEVSLSLNVEGTCMFSFLLMPYLKKLYLTGTEIRNSWFLNENVLYFLRYLELLHLGSTDIHHEAFCMLQKHCVNLTELFLCWTDLDDDDFSFSNLVFPQLKTICLRECRYVTCEGIVSLVQSCKSLQNVYVERHVAKSYAKHPFVIANKSKQGIVKGIESSLCENYYKERGFLVD